MRLRNIPGAREEMLVNPFVIQHPEELKGKWKSDLFKNDAPLYVEIGMGKGRFITELAKQHPEINFIGIEKFSSVLLRALQKRAELENSPETALHNLYYLRFDAEELTDIFDAQEVDRIYLNFSDPWPKDRHHKRRLTSREFLARYERILAENAVIEFKTDNAPLFDFSLQEIKESGWALLQMTRDLHRDAAMNGGNVMTEYEERFSLLGNPIMKLITKPGNGSMNS